MKGQILRICVLLAFVILGCSRGVAMQDPGGDGRVGDFDARVGQHSESSAPSAEQTTAVADLRFQLPGVRVDFDPLTGAPRLVSLKDGFLTTTNGQKPAAPGGAAAVAPVEDPNRAIKRFLEERRDLFGHGPEALNQTRITRDYVTPHNGMRTVAWQQVVDGIPVFEAVLVAHTTRRGELINVSSGFVPDPLAAATASAPDHAALVADPPLTAPAAVVAAARNLGETVAEPDVVTVEGDGGGGVERRKKFRVQTLRGESTASLVWLPMNRDEFRLCWDVILTSRLRGEMFRMLVDAQTGEVVIRRGLTRYISDASYRVYTSDSPSPFSPGHSTPLAAQPSLTNRVLLTLSALSTNASPNGWIDDGVNETMGNNVDAHADHDDDDFPDLPRPAGSPFRVFDFAMNPAIQSPTDYVPAAVVQLFYLCNWYHDRLYELGFTEAAGNFQINNFGRGGQGGDPVQADAQDGGGFNNANFSTPPDGFSGRMQMYVFSGPNPQRDGDFDAEIVFHEHTHGLSWRLVGGGQGLGTSQSDGMGEGWSDFYALTLLSEPGDNVNGCYAAGSYATYLLSGLTANYYFGIRRYPYSTDMTKNPLTFKDIDTSLASSHSGIPRSPIIGTAPSEVHNQGEVWCVALWEARANLINKHGWAVGNQLILQLVTDGMKLTPPAPNFLQARDAILQADLVNTGGANRAELWAAFAKRGMGYSATAPVSSSNTGIVEAYDVPDNLFISPGLVLSAGGTVGGPFTPNPASFVLTNTGSTAINWSVQNTSSWVNVAPTNGVLLAGGPSVNINVSILPVANTFSRGTYSSLLRFTNQSSGMVQSRTFELSIAGLNVVDDFDPDLDLSQWSAFGGTVGSTVRAIDSGGYVSFPNSLWFSDAGSRFATTVPIDTRGGGAVSFSIRLASGASYPWETADALPSEGVVLECSTNGGGSWILLGSYDTTTYYNWTAESFPIPPAAKSAATRFRWRQKSHSGSDFDHWALDDVNINAVPAQYLALVLPTNTVEGVGFVTGKVTVFPAPAADMIIAVDSSDPSEVVPDSPVIILAGQTNADVVLNVVDDSEFDGSQVVAITASADGAQNGIGTMIVDDNEVASLLVSLPLSTTEGAGSVSGLVKITNVVPTSDILVKLSSSDPTEIQVPATVLIPAGQTSVVFTVTVANDNLIDGPQVPLVTAHVVNWFDGVSSITVLDDETLNLTLSLPTSAYENAGVLSGAGRVGISGVLSTNLAVFLQSSDLTEATVPVSVTINAGQTNTTFDITMVDDSSVDGVQDFRVTATAPGFNAASNFMSALDDESPPAPTNPLPANQSSNIVANTSLSWSNGFADVTNDVYFGTAPGAGQMVFLGSTTGTNWTLPLLAPNTTYCWRIVARHVGSTAGPVWRFATQGVDHFAWSPIASPKYASKPFDVTVTAKDQFETTVSNFMGVVNLGGINAGLMTNKVIGDVLHTDSSAGNYTLAFAITPNTNLTVTHVRSYSGTKVSIWSNTGTLLASQNVSGPNGSWTETPLATPLQLLSGTTYRVSFYSGGSTTYYYRSDRPATFPNGTLVDGYYYASGDNFPSSFYAADRIIFLCDLSYTVLGAAFAPITPTVSGTFVNGAWTGNLSVLSTATNLVLRARDGSNHAGDSNPFDVLLQNDIAVAVTGAPDTVGVGANVTYTITVTNSGPALAEGVTVTNFLPATTTLGSVSLSQGTAVTNGNAVVCNLGSLPGSAAATITIVARTTVSGSITNVTTVSRAEVDALPGNNSAVAITSVQTPALSISSVSAIEGNAGTKPFVFTVSLSVAAITNVSVNFATANGSAMAGTDYFATNGTLNFNPGQTNQSFAVQVVGDTISEPNEVFTVTLADVTNALITGNIGTGTILNDENTGIVAFFTDNNSELTGWSRPITNAGFTPQWIADIGTFVLTNIDVMVIDESGNYGLSSALLARLPAIQAWVNSGGKLVIHDRSIGNLSPNPFLLGTLGITPERSEMTDIDVVSPATNLVVAGPRGNIDNTTLDGGNSSAHGYVSQTQLPSGSYPIISMGGNPSNVVCFSYPLGNGLIYYSSIPLDYYLAGSGPTGLIAALTDVYAPNVLAYVTGLPGRAPVPPFIITQPVGQTVSIGGSVMFSVAAVGGTPLLYQWRRNGDPIADATNLTYLINPVQYGNAGVYSVLVSNPYGFTNSIDVTLTVTPPVNDLAPLRFLSSEVIGSDVRFWLGTTDGSPIMPDRAAGIQFYSSSDMAQPVTNWVQMTNSVLLINNLLRLSVPSPLGSSLFIRAQESH